jgi:hypothetical protein
MLLLQLVPTDVMPRLVILGERQVRTVTNVVSAFQGLLSLQKS